jgi:hypothetical protein
MHWILIFWIVAGGGSVGRGAASAAVEFNDEAACHAAFATMQNTKNYDYGLWGVCVPKGSQ